MGYQAPRTTVAIDLTGTPWEGAEISASSASMGELLSLGDQPDRIRAGAGLAAVRELVEVFASKIISWNLENELGEPMPITVDAFLSLDFTFAGKLIKLWIDALTGQGDELGKGSTSGQRSAPPNFPMEPI